MDKDKQARALKALERQEKQYKRQNEYIKQNYFRTTITMSKDIGATIKENEDSINGYINRLVREDLTRRGLLDGEGNPKIETIEEPPEATEEKEQKPISDEDLMALFLAQKEKNKKEMEEAKERQEEQKEQKRTAKKEEEEKKHSSIAKELEEINKHRQEHKDKDSKEE